MTGQDDAWDALAAKARVGWAKFYEAQRTIAVLEAWLEEAHQDHPDLSDQSPLNAALGYVTQMAAGLVEAWDATELPDTPDWDRALLGLQRATTALRGLVAEWEPEPCRACGGLCVECGIYPYWIEGLCPACRGWVPRPD